MLNKIISISLLTALQHIPITCGKSHESRVEQIVFVSLHTIKGESLLKFHTPNGTVFDFVPNNKHLLNRYVIHIPLEEADRLGIPYRENSWYPKTTLDGRVECEDNSPATDKSVGIRPAPIKKEKRQGPVPLPVGSFLSIVTRGKNKGKYTVWGMEGVQNSLKRFAGVPIYVLTEEGAPIRGKVYNSVEDAQEFTQFYQKPVIHTVILKPEQIVR